MQSVTSSASVIPVVASRNVLSLDKSARASASIPPAIELTDKSSDVKDPSAPDSASVFTPSAVSRLPASESLSSPFNRPDASALAPASST